MAQAEFQDSVARKVLADIADIAVQLGLADSVVSVVLADQTERMVHQAYQAIQVLVDQVSVAIQDIQVVALVVIQESMAHQASVDSVEQTEHQDSVDIQVQ